MRAVLTTNHYPEDELYVVDGVQPYDDDQRYEVVFLFDVEDGLQARCQKQMVTRVIMVARMYRSYKKNQPSCDYFVHTS